MGREQVITDAPAGKVGFKPVLVFRRGPVVKDCLTVQKRLHFPILD